MKEEIIDDINYRLYDHNLTAEVINKNGGYEGDIIIPEIVVFNEATYRVTSIASWAFRGCQSLTSITIPDSVTSIGGGAFDNCDSLEQKPTQQIEIDELTYQLLMHNHQAELIIYTGDAETVAIPSEITFEGVSYRVTSIGYNVFAYCGYLYTIFIPESVTSIDSAIECCFNLHQIVVAEGNTVYDSRENCNAIIETATNTLIRGCENSTIPDSVTSIDDRAFADCSWRESIVIPDGVTSIGEKAFYGCKSLTSIIIPNSVESIGDGAFHDCWELTDITFQGTMEQWEKIELYNDWDADVPATVVHCTDGDVEIG